LPYGWERVWDTSGARPRTVGYKHKPEEVAVILRFRELRRISTQRLCDQLNAEGIPSPGKWRPSEKRPRSGLWRPNVIHKILNNPMIWGEYRYGERARVTKGGKSRVVPKATLPKAKVVVHTLQFPPILERAEVEDLKAHLAGRRIVRRVDSEARRPVHPAREAVLRAVPWGTLDGVGAGRPAVPELSLRAVHEGRHAGLDRRSSTGAFVRAGSGRRDRRDRLASDRDADAR